MKGLTTHLEVVLLLDQHPSVMTQELDEIREASCVDVHVIASYDVSVENKQRSSILTECHVALDFETSFVESSTCHMFNKRPYLRGGDS